MTPTQSIIPFLWFNADGEEAVAFSTSVFGGREISRLTYPRDVETPGGPPGTVVTIDFEIRGMRMTALNGGTDPVHTDATSLMIVCEDQAELDRIWQAILDHGGKGVACGWIQDRWGMRWQLAPKSLMELYATGDEAAIARAFKLMLTMVKLDGPALEAAARDKAA
jgi:predicted 3-demethylubiquinone-9 3-methyltransferase (glyoxalase superfamily)